MSCLRLPGQPQIASLVLEVEGAGWPSRSSKPLWGADQRPRWVRLPCTSATIGQVRQVGATQPRVGLGLLLPSPSADELTG